MQWKKVTSAKVFKKFNDHCDLYGDRPAGGERRHIACDRSAAEDGAGAALLFREEWRLCRQGKKVGTSRCGIGARGEAVLRSDQAIEEAVLERALGGWMTETVATLIPGTET